MRILLATELFPPVSVGGAEISVKELAAELGKDHEVVVFTPSYGGPLGFEDTENFRIFRYRNRFISMGSLLQQKLLFFREMTKHLSSFVRIFRPEVLHAQNALSAPPVAKVAEMHGLLGVAHVRDHRFECFTSRVACLSHRDATLLDFARCVDNPWHALSFPYAKLVTRSVQRAIIKCGRAFVISKYLRRELLQRIKLDARLCYDGVNAEKISKIRRAVEIRGRLIKSDNIILYAGGLHKFKGVFELLSGFVQVSKRENNASLLIAGDGPERTTALRFIEANGLGGKVTLLGSLSHETLISVIKAATIVAVPSLLAEGASLVAIEALACGKPVLGSNRGAVPEIVGDAGLTFPPLADNIARAIITMLDDRDRLDKMSILAKKRGSIFSVKSTSRQVVEVYENWLGALTH